MQSLSSALLGRFVDEALLLPDCEQLEPNTDTFVDVLHVWVQLMRLQKHLNWIFTSEYAAFIWLCSHISTLVRALNSIADSALLKKELLVQSPKDHVCVITVAEGV